MSGRLIVGYAIGRSIDARLTVAALKVAIERRRPSPGCIHHSDRGSQYAAQLYREALEANSLIGSMGRRGNPYDNAKAESFMSTLKREEVDGRAYRHAQEARRSIGSFIEEVYNRQRLHSALSYVAPADFEATLVPSVTTWRRAHAVSRG